MNAVEHAAAVLSFEIRRRTGDEELANAVFELLQPCLVIGLPSGDTDKFRALSKKFAARWPENP